MPKLLKKLIDRGDKVMIENGLLKIEAHSKKTPPESWFKINEDQLIKDIVRSFKLRLYKYSDYNLGHTKGHSQARLTLNFIEILTGETISLIFNVNRKRLRTSKNGKKGDPLPKGKFIVGKRSKLYELWTKLNLEKPRKPSEFNNKLSLLKGIYFFGIKEECNYGFKFKDKIIERANIISDDLMLANSQEDAKPLLNSRQHHAKESCQGFPPNPVGVMNCSKDNYVSSKVRIESEALRVTDKVNHSSFYDTKEKLPIDQSNKEWLDDYGEE